MLKLNELERYHVFGLSFVDFISTTPDLISKVGSLHAVINKTGHRERFFVKEIFSVEGHRWHFADCSEDEIVDLVQKTNFVIRF